ncbi:MAG TPA: hypothetical protein DDW36_03610 [Candidatus Magasanikbacteria bacterium]|nr:hypothetical protein [Candidatus Magasanikbacteria bacterium]
MPRKKKPAGPPQTKLDVLWWCLPVQAGYFYGGKTYRHTVAVPIAQKRAKTSNGERVLIIAALRALHAPHLDGVPDRHITISRVEISREVGIIVRWCHRNLGSRTFRTHMVALRPRGNMIRDERFRLVVLKALEVWFKAHYDGYDPRKLRLVEYSVSKWK